MASINASTSGAGGVITTADNTGTLQLQSGGTTIATISSTGITTQVGAPAFSAYQSVQQTGISSSVWTKVTLTTENFDTNSNFASSRFTPTVAGYYQINGAVTMQSVTTTHYIAAAIYKNGAIYSQGSALLGISSFYPLSIITTLVYLNGSTDYVELYCYGSAGGTFSLYNALENTYFNGAMVRSA